MSDVIDPGNEPGSEPDPLPAHGGPLVDLMSSPDQGKARALRGAVLDGPSWTLRPRQLCDLEMLLDGGFSPLRGFLCRADVESVQRRLRLADGTLWPLPVVLEVEADMAKGLKEEDRLALRDQQGTILALMRVQEVFEIDPTEHARAIYGTADPHHPGVRQLFQARAHGPTLAVGGPVEGLSRPRYGDFVALRLGPAAIRRRFAALGWQRVVAFQTRNPMHRAHYELTRRAMSGLDAHLLIHPAVGATKPGDVDHYTRVRCYRAMLPRYPEGSAQLALLPLAMRMAGPREAVLHAIVRRNYGCSHFIVGRDHAGPGDDTAGRPYHGPYEAQDLVLQHQDEIGIEMVPFRNMVWVPGRQAYLPEDRVPQGLESLSVSGSEIRRRLKSGQEIPPWATFPEVAQELGRLFRPRRQQGLTIFFTGLSAAGKSTLAVALLGRLLEEGGRPVTLLDGDLVRRRLSSELGFSKRHRDLNIRRIGFVAYEITKNGGVAICAPIAPYDASRKEIRREIEAVGGFVLIHLSTSLEACEARDPKGHYARARAGLMPGFTGIDDPYELPEDAELVIDTAQVEPAEAVEQILAHLQGEGYLASPAAAVGLHAASPLE